MAELLPEALGWIDAKKRAALQSLAGALADPVGAAKAFLSSSPEAFAETPQEQIARLAGNAQSVMPEVARPAAQELADVAGKDMIVPAGAPSRALWQEAIKAGLTPEQAWQATKTFRMPGGFLGQEVPDVSSVVLPAKELEAGPYTLRDVMSHPELFDRVPQLENTSIVADPWKWPGSAGYQPSKDLITVAGATEDAEHKRSVLHEIQHVVQTLFGWPRGGNVAAESESPFLRENLDKMLRGYQGTGLTVPQVTPDSVYRHLAGEAQARATEYRSVRQPQFLQSIPTDDYDVPLASVLTKWRSYSPAMAGLATALAAQGLPVDSSQ